MIPAIYDAFIAAGTPEDKARKAAEALTNYDQRFDRIEREMGNDQNTGRTDTSEVDGGVAIALDVAILIRVFFR